MIRFPMILCLGHFSFSRTVCRGRRAVVWTGNPRRLKPAARKAIPGIALALLVVVPSRSQADPRFEIEWRTVDDGGDMFSESSPSGRFEFSGTIGQPDAGNLSDTRFDLTGGFWNVCRASSPALPDPLCPDNGFGTKNRYLSFQAGDSGRSQAVQVTFLDMPVYDYPACNPPQNAKCDFEYAEGRTMWVQQPFLVTEASGSAGPAPPPTMWAATLDCDPYYTDWTQYNTVDVYDAGIIPDGVYEVRVIDSTCSTDDTNSFSPPLEVRMSKAGDVVGCCFDNKVPGQWDPPQGVVDFVDISCVVDKFKNTPGSLRKARADIMGNGPADPIPNRKVDFVDIGQTVDCFRNECTPPVGPPEVDPCP